LATGIDAAFQQVIHDQLPADRIDHPIDAERQRRHGKGAVGQVMSRFFGIRSCVEFLHFARGAFDHLGVIHGLHEDAGQDQAVDRSMSPIRASTA
jgi:hypothetical protein